MATLQWHFNILEASGLTTNNNIRAIIWDYDGTLVDTTQKNLNVTKKIILDLNRDPDTIKALHSLENYKNAIMRTENWRELYTAEFGLSEELTDTAGTLWTEYQMNDTTPALPYDGIDRVLENLKAFPQGIVSANAHSNIERALRSCDLLTYFRCIIGYEQVGLERQKPEADGVLKCLGNMADIDNGVIFYIGDHETDVRCVRNANKALREQGQDVQIVSIAAFYDSKQDASEWGIEPDFRAQETEEIIDIIQSFQFHKFT